MLLNWARENHIALGKLEKVVKQFPDVMAQSQAQIEQALNDPEIDEMTRAMLRQSLEHQHAVLEIKAKSHFGQLLQGALTQFEGFIAATRPN